jgi:hypothetical protein
VVAVAERRRVEVMLRTALVVFQVVGCGGREIVSWWCSMYMSISTILRVYFTVYLLGRYRLYTIVIVIINL